MNLEKLINASNPFSWIIKKMGLTQPNNNIDSPVSISGISLPSNTGYIQPKSLKLKEWDGECCSNHFVIPILDKLTVNINLPLAQKWENASRPSPRGGASISVLSGKIEKKFHLREMYDESILLTCNPSKFENYTELEKTIGGLFEGRISDCQIKKVTCALTFPFPFYSVMLGLDYGKSRSTMQYKDEAKGKSFYIGKDGNSFKTLVYDKSKEAGLNYQCTRLETTIKGTNLADLRFGELSKISQFKPFNSLSLNQINFLRPEQASARKMGRYIELIAQTNNSGFYSAKRLFNRSGNYKRTFGALVQENRVHPNLNELFQTGIKSYFKEIKR